MPRFSAQPRYGESLPTDNSAILSIRFLPGCTAVQDSYISNT